MHVIVFAFPVFLAAIGLEYAVSVWMGRRVYRFNDAVNSLSLGVLSQISGVFTKALTIGIYSALVPWVALFHLSASDWKVWVGALIAYDFCYYWNHRLGHISGIFWAAHVVHHQSEDYNLSTALRQTSSGALLGWIFYLPLAICGVPPLVFAIVALIDLLYQFWIHTELVGKLGWFDRVFASPSNHRVHHAVNRDYLDHNYGGIFILWDRLFGTFIEETKPCIYGVRPRLASWDPIWANLDIYFELAERSWKTKHWGDKLRVWFAPPSWTPEDLKGLSRAPKLPPGAKVYDVAASPLATGFAVLVLALAILGTSAYLFVAEDLTLGPALIGAGAITVALWAGGAAMQARITLLEGVFLLVAAAACAASVFGPREAFVVLKPGATALAALAVYIKGEGSTLRRALLIAALLASTLGDALLLSPALFIPGLVAFLIAHVLYIALLTRDAKFFASKAALAFVAVYAAAMLIYLWPHIGSDLKAPVTVYVVVICVMLAQALGRALSLGCKAAALVAFGALAFVVSDTCLALNLFAGAGEVAERLVLPTYWLAQALIAFNVLSKGDA